MKAQMKFQKILTLVSLIVGALVFVFALIFTTGALSDLLPYHSKYLASGMFKTDVADKAIEAAQSVSATLLILGIIIIVAAALLYITSTNSRRNYYVTNYVAIGVFIAATLATVIAGFVLIGIASSEFANVDFNTLDKLVDSQNEMFELGLSHLPRSTPMFGIGFGVMIVVLFDALAWVFNLVWKILLMRGEKALLNGKTTTEVA